MANLGLFFKGENKNYIIFVNLPKLKKDSIVGFSIYRDQKVEVLTLNKDLSFSEHLLLDIKTIRSVKISVAEQRMIDFEDLTLWFKGREYKELRQLFEIEDNIEKQDLMKKVINILDYFK